MSLIETEKKREKQNKTVTPSFLVLESADDISLKHESEKAFASNGTSVFFELHGRITRHRVNRICMSWPSTRKHLISACLRSTSEERWERLHVDIVFQLNHVATRSLSDRNTGTQEKKEQRHTVTREISTLSTPNGVRHTVTQALFGYMSWLLQSHSTSYGNACWGE